jgi:hypothetical protein
MSEQDPNEFTDREKFILSYYRSAELSGSRRVSFHDLTIASVSVACIVLFYVGGESAYGFVGYALLLGRLIYLVVEGGRWSRDFRSIFAKYDAKLKALAEGRSRKQDGDEAA